MTRVGFDLKMLHEIRCLRHVRSSAPHSLR
jgi:hypothetical protein